MKCKHENADHLMAGDTWSWREDQPTLTALCEQFRCLDCGAWLSLGPATDDERTAVEVRAAEIAADALDGVGLGGHRPDHCTGEHCWHFYEEFDDDAGPCCYCGHPGPILPFIDNECQAGYLARCIVQYDTDGGDE